MIIPLGKTMLSDDTRRTRFLIGDQLGSAHRVTECSSSNIPVYSDSEWRGRRSSACQYGTCLALEQGKS